MKDLRRSPENWAEENRLVVTADFQPGSRGELRSDCEKWHRGKSDTYCSRRVVKSVAKRLDLAIQPERSAPFTLMREMVLACVAGGHNARRLEQGEADVLTSSSDNTLQKPLQL
jgi:hypothetical protein